MTTTLPARSGIALVICAPSGAGKTTLVKRLVAEFPRFAFSVSCTTRAPRPEETPGTDYLFISREEFLRRRDAGYFAEWALVHGNFYGTPLEATRELLVSGRDVLFDIDVQGASQLRHTIPGAWLIFILPPSRGELISRLRNRRTETPESLRKRLLVAGQEILQAGWFHLWIVNDDLERAWQELRAAYISATLSPACRAGLLDELLKEWRPA
ncbi:MAG: guanylate kinase [Deltaproteobacteria bacterium]|jgi:guanylate kinase|nr:guanylate kinase [Deltaproteobacteria bacterium]